MPKEDEEEEDMSGRQSLEVISGGPLRAPLPGS